MGVPSVIPPAAADVADGPSGRLAWAWHRTAVQAALASYRAIPPQAPVRLEKTTSNLFRSRQRLRTPGLTVTGLDRVISVDTTARTADVGGMCSYQTLVAATLPHGLAPLVVPQLKTITVGGAVTGGGIESTSFRNGLAHDAIAELDILTGAGTVLTASTTENADLYYGFPNSYGTLGYAVRLRVRLEPVTPYVALRHLRFSTVTELQDELARIVATRSHDGVRVDHLDGVVFSKSESYLTLGTFTDEAGPTSDYTGQAIYYRSIQQRRTDLLTVHDYLWRWDTDWFWCSRAFGAQRPLIRRWWPRRLRRSSFYWKLVALDRRFGIADRNERWHGRPPLERVVQDIEVPVERTADFVDWFLGATPIEPVWVCPVRLPANPNGTDAPTWPLYPMPPEQTFVNVGFWSTVPQVAGAPDGATNRLIEQRVAELGGHKSLYSDAYYSEPEFAERYGGVTYHALKSKYDPDSRLLTLYDKAVKRR